MGLLSILHSISSIPISGPLSFACLDGERPGIEVAISFVPLVKKSYLN